jgi:hypothetical protein
VRLVDLIGHVWWPAPRMSMPISSISEPTQFNLVLDKNVVGIAVQPALARLSRGNYRMSAGVRVFAGVLIRRAIAAQRYAACLACPQMHPIATDLYALFAFVAFRLLNRVDRIKMRTAASSHRRVSLFRVTRTRNDRDPRAQQSHQMCAASPLGRPDESCLTIGTRYSIKS